MKILEIKRHLNKPDESYLCDLLKGGNGYALIRYVSPRTGRVGPLKAEPRSARTPPPGTRHGAQLEHGDEARESFGGLTTASSIAILRYQVLPELATAKGGASDIGGGARNSRLSLGSRSPTRVR